MAVNIVLTAILRANIAQFVNGMSRAGSALGGLQNAAKSLNALLDATLWYKILEVILQIESAIQGVVVHIIDTASKWQGLQVSMAAVLLATNKITDASGKQLTYAEQFNRAIIISKDLMNKLRMDAVLSVGTTEDLTNAYIGLGNAVSATTRKGENGIEKTRKMANAMVATSYVLGPSVMKGGINQVIRETNALLTGKNDRINTLARTLGLTDGLGKKAYDAAKKEGRLYDFLMAKLKPYIQAQEILSHTLEGLKNTLKDMLQYAEQMISEFDFKRINSALQEFTNYFVTRLPDGTAKASKKFEFLLRQLGVIFDEIMIPVLNLQKSLMKLFTENTQGVTSYLSTIGQLNALFINLTNTMILLLRPFFRLFGMGSISLVDSLYAILVLLNGALQTLNSWIDKIDNAIGPMLDGAYAQLQKIHDMYQKMAGAFGVSTNLQEEDNKKKKEAEILAQTQVESIGGLTDALNENNKKVKDNTQHWRNWISTMRSAFSTRFPSAAKSFLTTFGAGGALNPTRGGIGATDVNINLRNADGSTMSIPAQMTPQQLAQAHQNARTFSGSLNKMTKGKTLNPISRNGPAFQN
jgi:hypothetical protein